MDARVFRQKVFRQKVFRQKVFRQKVCPQAFSFGRFLFRQERHDNKRIQWPCVRFSFSRSCFFCAPAVLTKALEHSDFFLSALDGKDQTGARIFQTRKR